MRKQLEEFFKEYTIPSLDGSKQAVYGKGQIDLVNAVSEGKKAFIDNYQYLRDV
jgi:hypothetical protein